MSRLEENYETAEGVCIPRSTLYMHYVDFCERNGMQPVNAASFGKVKNYYSPNYFFNVKTERLLKVLTDQNTKDGLRQQLEVNSDSPSQFTTSV